MSSKSSTENKTTTTTQQLSDEQQRVLDLAMPQIETYAANTPERYQGDTVADFTAPQVAGQNMALSAADTQNQIAQNAANTSDFYLSGNIWDPANNPYLQSAIDAALRPITENYQQNVVPGIRDEYQQIGQEFGGSRKNLSEVQGANAYMRNIGDTASKLVQNQYQTNIEAQLKALGLAGDTQKLQTQGAATTSAVGDVQQAQNQAEIDAAVNAWNYDQTAGLTQAETLLNMLNSINNGSTTSTSTGTTNSTGGGTATSTLGGAASGAALGSAILPGVGTAAGATLGGLLGYLNV